MLTENANLFLENATPKLNPGQIDLKLHGGWYDDLLFPVIRIRSKISNSERMRKYGIEAFSPRINPKSDFAMDENGNFKRSAQGYYIPSENYIRDITIAYGDIYQSKQITLEPYRKMPIEKALDRAGTDLKGMVETGEYEIVIDELHCLRCGHTWLPRSDKKPKWCPNCNSPYWDKPRQKSE